MLNALRSLIRFFAEVIGLVIESLPTLFRAIANGDWPVVQHILAAYRQLLVSMGYFVLSMGYFVLAFLMMVSGLIGGVSLMIVGLGLLLMLLGVQLQGILWSIFVIALQGLFLALLLGVVGFVVLRMQDEEQSFVSSSSTSSTSSSSNTSSSYSSTSSSSQSSGSTSRNNSNPSSQITELANSDSDPVTTLSTSYDDFEVDEYGQLVENP